MPQVNNITLNAADITDISANEVYDVVNRVNGMTVFRYAGANPLVLARVFTHVVGNMDRKSNKILVKTTYKYPFLIAEQTTLDGNEYGSHRRDTTYTIDRRATQAQILEFVERCIAFDKDADLVVSIKTVSNFF